MKSSYLLFNKIIAAFLAAIIVYCAIYPWLGDYTVKCAVEQATGHPCIGCGLTRGTNQALMFNFDKALMWNSSSILILAFFLISIAARFVINFILKRDKSPKLILIADIVISLTLFLYCFRHFFTTTLLR